MNQPTAKQLLFQGLCDAAGFLGGAVLGMWLCKALGFPAFAPGYSAESIYGIVLVVVGGGLGVQLARRWFAGRIKNQRDSQDYKDE